MEEHSLPVGFAMALAQNEKALEKFSSMTEAQKDTIINETHNIRSKREMHEFVAGIGETKTDG